MDFIEKANNLPKRAKEFFFSNDIRMEMEKACFLYGIPEKNMTIISDITAFIFIGDIRLSDLPALIKQKENLDEKDSYGLAYELNKRLFSPFSEVFDDTEILLDKWSRLKSDPKMTEEDAVQKMFEIETWILEDEKEKIKYQEGIKKEEKIYRQNMEEIPISEGLKKYPEAGEQIITSQHIKLKIFPEPVRPSIKNWLSDYTFNLGYENHDSMTRGDYLFKSDNGKNLSQEDREKLSLILKSYDENIPLTIDISAKQVLFPKNQTEKENKITAAMIAESRNLESMTKTKTDFPKPDETAQAENAKKPILNDGNIKFSFPQIFANEKKSIEARINQPIRIKPASRENFNGYSKENKDLPKNIINLKNNDVI